MRANIQFLWELEEEIGSPHFAAGLAAAVAGDAAAGRAPLPTDSVVVSDTIWIAAGQPSISYGLRGLMGFTIALETGAKDVHSGTTGGLARNPIGELAALIAECYDARTGKVKIPGFYDDVRKLSRGREEGVRAGAASRASSFAAAHELGVAASDPRRRRRPGRAHGGADVRGARPRRRLLAAPASRPSSPTAPRPSCRRASSPIRSRRRSSTSSSAS